MPTYQVVCSVCNEDRWPVLPERPAPKTYICTRCQSVPPDALVKRREMYAKRGNTRIRKKSSGGKDA